MFFHLFNCQTSAPAQLHDQVPGDHDDHQLYPGHPLRAAGEHGEEEGTLEISAAEEPAPLPQNSLGIPGPGRESAWKGRAQGVLRRI